MIYLYNVATKKEVLVTIRVAENVRDEFKKAAELRGSTMSGLMHQFIIRTIREEKQISPQIFAITPEPTRGIKAAEIHLQPQKGKVVAHIGPAVDPKAEVRKMVSGEQIDEMAKRLKPRKRKTG